MAKWLGSRCAWTASQAVWDKFIIPDTAAAHATGKTGAEEAVKKAEFQIKRIYKRYA